MDEYDDEIVIRRIQSLEVESLNSSYHSGIIISVYNIRYTVDYIIADIVIVGIGLQTLLLCKYPIELFKDLSSSDIPEKSPNDVREEPDDLSTRYIDLMEELDLIVRVGGVHTSRAWNKMVEIELLYTVFKKSLSGADSLSNLMVLMEAIRDGEIYTDSYFYDK